MNAIAIRIADLLNKVPAEVRRGVHSLLVTFLGTTCFYGWKVAALGLVIGLAIAAGLVLVELGKFWMAVRRERASWRKELRRETYRRAMHRRYIRGY